jgi:hypothetical protein
VSASGSVYGASACHRVAVLAKSPHTRSALQTMRSAAFHRFRLKAGSIARRRAIRSGQRRSRQRPAARSDRAPRLPHMTTVSGNVYIKIFRIGRAATGRRCPEPRGAGTVRHRRALSVYGCQSDARAPADSDGGSQKSVHPLIISVARSGGRSRRGVPGGRRIGVYGFRGPTPSPRTRPRRTSRPGSMSPTDGGRSQMWSRPMTASASVDVNQPLIPRPLALREVRQDEPTSRLVAERQRRD